MTRKPLVVLAAALVALTAGTAHAGLTFTVTNTNDSGPGSLRQEILNANKNQGKNTIAFDIPGPGVHTIEPLSDLPGITGPVTIDGETQPGYQFPFGPPLIQILGDQDTVGTGIGRKGLILYTGPATIEGLAIGDFDQGIEVEANGSGSRIVACVIGADPQGRTVTPNGVGIHIDGNGNTVGGSSLGAGNVISGNTIAGVVVEIGDDNVIDGNTIGATAGGLRPLPNGIGVAIDGLSRGNRIGDTNSFAGNLISGNLHDGIAVEGRSPILPSEELNGSPSATLIQHNRIGTTGDGSGALPNANGVVVLDASTDTQIGGDGAAGNLISGNAGDGVRIYGDPAASSGSPTGSAIQGNLIGTNGNGTAALGNGGNGVGIYNAFGNLVGGSLLFGSGNVISGQDGGGSSGVDIGGGGDNQISSNLIGTSADGMSAIPNKLGISISESAGNLIGRATGPHSIRGGGNVISGNSFIGIWETSDSGDQITGNVIGRNADNSSALGNPDGVDVLDDATATIGDEHDPNVIADNPVVGVSVQDSSFGVRISANSIFGNQLFSNTMGIDLNADGVTPNDPGDSDAGPNGLQNFPVITSVDRQGGQIRIDGTLNSRPFGSYRVEFFANTACDRSGYGEGETYLGATTVITDAFGNVAFSAKFPLNPSAPTPIVTATATDQSGNTSEFSACSSSG